jgi:hypothetical protein
MRQGDSDEEDIEGLGKDEDAGWGEYPIDTVLIRTETRTVYDVLRKIERGSFVMNPEFKKGFHLAGRQAKQAYRIRADADSPAGFLLGRERPGPIVRRGWIAALIHVPCVH